MAENRRMRITLVISVLLIGGVLLVLGACGSAAIPSVLTPKPASTNAIPPVTLAPAPTTPAIPATPALPVTPVPAAAPIPVSPTLAPQLIPVPGPDEVWLWGGEYRPNRLTVPLGTTVVWIGRDADPHDVENNNGLFFASLPLGVTFNYTFIERGAFFYHCECNTGMEGTIIVE